MASRKPKFAANAAILGSAPRRGSFTGKDDIHATFEKTGAGDLLNELVFPFLRNHGLRPTRSGDAGRYGSSVCWKNGEHGRADPACVTMPTALLLKAAGVGIAPS